MLPRQGEQNLFHVFCHFNQKNNINVDNYFFNCAQISMHPPFLIIVSNIKNKNKNKNKIRRDNVKIINVKKIIHTNIQ